MEDAAAGAGPATRGGAMGVAPPPTLADTATPLVIVAGDASNDASGMLLLLLLLLLPPPPAVVVWRLSLISLSHALQSLSFDLYHYVNVHLVATLLHQKSLAVTLLLTGRIPFSSSIGNRAVVHCEFPGR